MQEEIKISGIQTIDTDQQPAGLRFFENRVQAGFPSPAQNEYADSIDLNRALITNPAATFCAHVIGNSMVDAGINEGDLLIIDRSIVPHDGNIAVCFIDGDFTVKRLSVREDGVFLTPANAKFPELKVGEESNFKVWGVVSHIIKKV
ncbi:MAG: translesion error-prone DNA polymerase V autoproteolytic subunit [Muribaculaceae bacterium]|nr:translesion error-prone DNA polymerase V autoproteolytic subunit [Muribaculaceae bacterium]